MTGRRLLIAAALAGGLAGCAAPSPSPAPTGLATQAPAALASPVPATPTPPPSATPSSTPTATPTIAPTPTRAPADLAHPRLVVLAENLPGPDDLLLAPDGSLYLTDVVDGTIKRFTGSGPLNVVAAGLNEPEGMAWLPDGALLVVEQGRNQLTRYDFTTKAAAPFLKLENTTGKPGVDSVAADAQGILIPDSPNGRVLRASFDGKTVTVLARGLGRPTGAWPEADGSWLIVDENTGWLKRLRPDGRLESLALLPVPDDVAADERGNIYVVTLQDGAVHVLPAGASQAQLLLDGLKDPQGLILDADGNLIVAEAGRHRLIRIVLR